MGRSRNLHRAAMAGNASGKLRVHKAMGVEAAVRSHTGLVRDHNEDTFVCLPRKGLFAVIDGMGGENAGEVASSMAARRLEAIEEHEALAQAIHEANTSIVRRSQSRPAEKGMGCVMTAIRLRGGDVELAHVGDTRAYLVSDAGAEQLTRDHTAIAEAQAALGLSEAEASRMPNRHQVTRDVGRELHADMSWIDQSTASVMPGDLMMLCSDGLHDMVPHQELVRILSTARRNGMAVDAMVQHLIDLALERGGHDNVTVLVLRRTEAAPHSRLQLLLAAFTGVVLVAVGFVLGLFWAGRTHLPSPESPGQQQVSHPGFPAEALVANPVELLSGVLTRSATLDLDEPVIIDDSPLVTRLADGVDVRLLRLDLGTGGEAAVWQIMLATGASLQLEAAVLDAPGLEVMVALEGPDSLLELKDCRIGIKSFQASGPAGSLVKVSGESWQLFQQEQVPILDGATLVWNQRPLKGGSLAELVDAGMVLQTADPVSDVPQEQIP